MHVSDDESHAFAREFLGDGAPDSAARPGHDGDFFAQLLHVAQGSKGCETFRRKLFSDLPIIFLSNFA
jgi:hypothetical protein